MSLSSNLRVRRNSRFNGLDPAAQTVLSAPAPAGQVINLRGAGRLAAEEFPETYRAGARLPTESRRNSRLESLRYCAAVALFLATTPLLAGTNYITAGRPDGIALLPPPPARGSVEEAADLASARAVFHGRTPAETVRAREDSGLSFKIFSKAIDASFQPGKMPRTDALLQQVKAEIGQMIDTLKNHWKRLRPYQLDPELSLGQPEDSFSYPSGHSTRGTVYSLVLAEIYPEKREDILAIGRDIGWDRVLIGKHFPTDVYAGRVLGQAIMRELLASAVFQRDLAAAKAEARTLREASSGPRTTAPAFAQ